MGVGWGVGGNGEGWATGQQGLLIVDVLLLPVNYGAKGRRKLNEPERCVSPPNLAFLGRQILSSSYSIPGGRETSSVFELGSSRPVSNKQSSLSI